MIEGSFWKNKKVFLTGHTGFKGSWLSMWLTSLGANVRGFSLAPPSHPSLFKISSLDKFIDSQIGDVRDYDALLLSIKDFKPDIVFHLAAQSLVKKSYFNPIDTYNINVIGTLNLFEVIRSVGNVKVIVNITSDKCYENKEWHWGYRENEPMGGYDPYSSSKGCAEILTASYRQSYFHPDDYDNHGLAIASARAGNVIGGGDWAEDRLIPDILKAFQKKQPVLIRNPGSIRPWQHVLEPLSGYLILAERLYHNGKKYAEGWNFGPISKNELSVEDIVSRLAKLWEEDAHWSLDKNFQPHEAHFLKLDCSKAQSRLNWSPKWAIDDVLKRIVDWHKAWINGQNMLDYCLTEINDYMHRA